MASAHDGTSVSSTSGATIYDPAPGGADPQCAVYRIKNRSTSGAVLKINVAGIHAVGEFEAFEPGDGQLYKATKGGAGVGKITAKVASSTATLDGGCAEALP